MTITLRAADLSPEDLEEKPLAQPSAEPLSGPITTRSRVVFTNPDETVLCGTWECEPGRSRWEFLDRGEFVHVLSGRMVVTEDGQDGVELVAGCSAVFPVGWAGTWEVTETLRKVFTVFRR